jgi:hypothetical protein
MAPLESYSCDLNRVKIRAEESLRFVKFSEVGKLVVYRFTAQEPVIIHKRFWNYVWN